MMKKNTKIGLIVALAAMTAFSSGCSDDFLSEKQNYGNYTDVIYNDYEGAKGRVNFLYAILLPYTGGSTTNFGWHSIGESDDFSKSTEEYGGFSSFVDPNKILDNTTVTDYIYGENKNVSPYGRIRECNMILDGIKNSSLPETQKEELLGQVYFFRAWCYYRLVKIYGGIPIIDYVQNPLIGESGGVDLVVPRATTKACIDFICQDLEIAASYLPAKWDIPASDYGRVTSGTAMALAGRTRLLYASPLFNRSDNADRWNLAYEATKEAKDKLAYSFGDAGSNASKWAGMFVSYENPEAVFIALYNNLNGGDYKKNNGWENGIRPSNIYGGGGKSSTAEMVDLFPMADGKKPGTSQTYVYDKEMFFVNRDPRFYRTFAFPGVRWAASADLSKPNSEQPLIYPYAKGESYELWGYSWYADAETQGSDGESGWGADGLGSNNKSIYIRKRTDDFDINKSSFYSFDLTNKFALSATPYMEIRYAEVLLNFAEAACGANKLDEALNALKEVRARVGYTADNNYGLSTDLGSSRAKLFAAILYERQVELAFEGKRFDDMRRWLLWDGGSGQETVKSTWKLTGFDGNTCTYLGVSPLNGTRRTGIEMRVADSRGFAARDNSKDPLKAAAASGDATAARPVALNLMTDVTVAEDVNKPIDKLVDFYRANLKRKEMRIDGDTRYTIKFQPQYYIIGFRTNMQANNTQLLQTVGWADYMNGGAPGTFDPLAE